MGVSLSGFPADTTPEFSSPAPQGNRKEERKKKDIKSGSGDKTTLLTGQVRLRNKTGAYSNFQNKLISGLHEIHGEVFK